MFKNLVRAAAVIVFAAAALPAPARAAQAQGATPNSARPAPQTDRQAPQTDKQDTRQGGAQPAPAQPAAGAQQQQQSGAAQPTTMLRREEGHEWAPVLEQKIDYKDWTFKSLKDGAPVSVRELARGKKLLMVVYFAPWCGNWKAEAPTVWRLYEKYKAQGFEVVGVSEYASLDDSRKYFESQGGAPFPVVVESETPDAREKTTHHAYRQACGDPRRWGSPFNVFLEPSKLKPSGETLTERAWVVGGELVEKDVENFIRERLGLNEQGAAAPCKDEPKAEARAEARKQ
ncbi:MAG TPA: TlpA disulfide reductase family protein [Pyrinomonadaceae bacterium]|jgi:thiol-disulfide isomerase/thioredoxin